MKSYTYFSPILLLTAVFGIALTPLGVGAEEERERKRVGNVDIEEVSIAEREVKRSEQDEPTRVRIQRKRTEMAERDEREVKRIRGGYNYSDALMDPMLQAESERLAAEIDRLRAKYAEEFSLYQKFDLKANVYNNTAHDLRDSLLKANKQLNFFLQENNPAYSEKTSKIREEIIRLDQRLEDISAKEAEQEVLASKHRTMAYRYEAQANALDLRLNKIFHAGGAVQNHEIQEASEELEERMTQFQSELEKLRSELRPLEKVEHSLRWKLANRENRLSNLQSTYRSKFDDLSHDLKSKYEEHIRKATEEVEEVETRFFEINEKKKEFLPKIAEIAAVSDEVKEELHRLIEVHGEPYEEERVELENFVLATEAWAGTLNLVEDIHEIAADNERLRVFALQRLEDVIHDPEEHLEYLTEIIMESQNRRSSVYKAAWMTLAQLAADNDHEEIAKEIYLSFIIDNKPPEQELLIEWLEDQEMEDEDYGEGEDKDIENDVEDEGL